MANFSEFGNIFSDRYNRAVDAAEQQRVRDRGVEEHFHDQVFNGENTQVDGPTPPQPSSMGAQEQQFDPGVDQQVEQTKDYLLKISKDRLNQVASFED